jgi:hypothetical protein
MLAFAMLLAGLLAASLASGPISAALPTSSEPVDASLAGTAASSASDGDALVPVDAIATGAWRPGVAAAWRVITTPCAVPRTVGDPLGAPCGRAPPLT